MKQYKKKDLTNNNILERNKSETMEAISILDLPSVVVTSGAGNEKV